MQPLIYSSFGTLLLCVFVPLLLAKDPCPLRVCLLLRSDASINLIESRVCQGTIELKNVYGGHQRRVDEWHISQEDPLITSAYVHFEGNCSEYQPIEWSWTMKTESGQHLDLSSISPTNRFYLYIPPRFLRDGKYVISAAVEVQALPKNRDRGSNGYISLLPKQVNVTVGGLELIDASIGGETETFVQTNEIFVINASEGISLNSVGNISSVKFAFACDALPQPNRNGQFSSSRGYPSPIIRTRSPEIGGVITATTSVEDRTSAAGHSKVSSPLMKVFHLPSSGFRMHGAVNDRVVHANPSEFQQSSVIATQTKRPSLGRLPVYKRNRRANAKPINTEAYPSVRTPLVVQYLDRRVTSVDQGSFEDAAWFPAGVTNLTVRNKTSIFNDTSLGSSSSPMQSPIQRSTKVMISVNASAETTDADWVTFSDSGRTVTNDSTSKTASDGDWVTFSDVISKTTRDGASNTTRDDNVTTVSDGALNMTRDDDNVTTVSDGALNTTRDGDNVTTVSDGAVTVDGGPSITTDDVDWITFKSTGPITARTEGREWMTTKSSTLTTIPTQDGTTSMISRMTITGMFFPSPNISMCSGLHRPFKISDKPYIRLRASDFPPSNEYIFRVYAWIESEIQPRQICVDWRIHFVDYLPRKYQIRCQSNCVPSILASESVELVAVCSNCDADVVLEWRIEVISEQGDIRELLDWATLTYSYDRSNPHLIFRPGVFDAPDISSVLFTLFDMHSNLRTKVASRRIPVVASLFVASCTASPREGWELITNFAVSCSVTSQTSAIRYVEYRQEMVAGPHWHGSDIMLEYSTALKVSDLKLAAGLLSNNYRTRIIVEIVDSFYRRTKVYLNIIVKPLCMEGGCRRIQLDCIFMLLENQHQTNYFIHLLNHGHFQTYTAVAHIITYMLNRADMSKDTNESIKIRYAFLELADAVPLFSLLTIKQVAGLVGTIFCTSQAELPNAIQLLGLDILIKASVALNKIAVESEVKPQLTQQVARNISFALSDIFESVGCNDSDALPGGQKIEKLESIFYFVAKALLYFLGEENLTPEIVSTNNFNLLVQISTLQKLRGVKFGRNPKLSERDQLGFFRIPANYVSPSISDKQLLTIKLVQFKHHLLKNDSLEGNIRPISIFIRDKISGKLVNHYIAPIDVFLSNRGDVDLNPLKTMHLSEARFRGPADNDIGFETVDISPSSLPTDLMIVASFTSPSHSVQLITTKNVQPAIRHFLLDHIYDNVTYLTPDVRTTDFREDAAMIHIDSAVEPFTLYAAILPTQEMVSDVFREFADKKITPYYNYSLTILVMKCLHWNKKENAWSKNDCEIVADESIGPSLLHCRCSSLSRFSGVVAKAPGSRFGSDSDDNEFYLRVPFNYFALMAILVIILIFIVLLILAFYIDSWLRYKCGVTVIKDNDPCECYSYLVTLSTGRCFGSGTTSCAAIQLHGTQGVSVVHLLADRQRVLFQRATDDHFLITTKQCLGELQKVLLIRKLVEPKTSWYLKRITVCDMQNFECWEFPVNSLLQGDGLFDTLTHEFTGHKLVHSDWDKISSVNERLYWRFADDYVWTSFILRPPFTPFTSVQRILCILLLVQFAFSINLLVRGIPSSSVLMHIGVYGFRVTSSDVIYGIISGAILLLITLFVVCILKRWCTRICFVFIDLDDKWHSYIGNVICLDAVGEETISAADPSLEKTPVIETRFNKCKDQPSLVTFIVNLGSEGIAEIQVYPKQEQVTPQHSVIRCSTSVNQPPNIDKTQGSEELNRSCNALLEKSVPSSHATKQSRPEESLDQNKTSGEKCQLHSSGSGKKLFERLFSSRNIIWMVVTLAIVCLAVFNIMLASRYSITQTQHYVFSSLFGLFFCMLLLHPLALFIIGCFLPLRTGMDKKCVVTYGLSNIFHARRRMIRKTGTLLQYQQYLSYLRLDPVYYTPYRFSKPIVI